MNKQSGRISLFLLAGIFAIVALAGVFVYQTFSSYKELLGGKGTESPAATSTEEGAATNSATNTQNNETPTITVTKALEEKNILMVIAFKDFRDEEYFVPKQLFLIAGANVMTASDERGMAQGSDGGNAPVDVSIKEINLDDFDAVVFIGGAGALEHLDNEDSYKLAQETVSQNKVLAAICVSPVILAKAGVLSGKKATVWTSPLDKSAVNILEENGAIYEEKSVVQAGTIITGSGPEAAEEFGMKVIEVLTGI